MGPEPNHPHDKGSVEAREDLWETAQCPSCHVFIGVYVISPLDPTVEPKLMLIPPDKVQEVATELKERWRAAGTLIREGTPSISPETSDA